MSETSAIADGFVQRGYDVVPFEKEADVVFMNTCTVTDGADSSCRNMSRKAQKNSPEAKIVVSGCYAQREAEKVKAIKVEKAKPQKYKRELELPAIDAELEPLIALLKLEIEKAIPRLQDRVSRTVIKARMDGIVNKIFYRTPGGFIRTGDPVLEFVPTGEALIVEGRIAPQDISKIAVGDEVRIRFSAYDSSKYGHVMGEVDRISADAELDERSGASHYLIDVLIAGELVIDEEPVEFLPGMTASVDVLSGKRTVFEYLWQPVSSVGELALRD